MLKTNYRPIKIALLGAGSVGSQVARLLIENSVELTARVGTKLELVAVSVRSLEAQREYAIPTDLLTLDAEKAILGSDIVVELIGGIEPARSLIRLALESGCDVVTANKALLAVHGRELFELAEQLGAQLYYEASVGGAIPIIRPLRESLAGDAVERIMGIVNGTTNFILDKMESTKSSFEDALAEAQRLGYAEADPTADVGGHDAAAKAAILSSLAFHTDVSIDQVYVEGIERITAADIASANSAGYTIKLLAICQRVAAGGDFPAGISARVHPTLIPKDHPLASVRGAFNAVFVESEASGELMFYGAGAGGIETASAVLGDLVIAAKRHLAGGPGLADSIHANLPILPIEAVSTRYQMSLEVLDKPGVLAEIASIFATHDVSVETVEQTTRGGSESAALLTIVTHKASEQDLQKLAGVLRNSDVVTALRGVVRVEGV